MWVFVTLIQKLQVYRGVSAGYEQSELGVGSRPTPGVHRECIIVSVTWVLPW